MIFRRPVFWLILVFAALMIFVPASGNRVSMREDLVLVAIAIIWASNLNLMIGYTGYVNFGHIVFYGLGGYVGLYLVTVRHSKSNRRCAGRRRGRQPVCSRIRAGHSPTSRRLLCTGYDRYSRRRAIVCLQL